MATTMQPGNLCSRDTASRDYAFLSRILATSTTVSKTPRGQCKRSQVNISLLYQKPKMWH